MKDPAQTILDTLAEIGPARLGAIADHSGCTAQSLKWALKELRAKGKIVSTGATVARVHALPGQKPAEGSAPPPAAQEEATRHARGYKEGHEETAPEEARAGRQSALGHAARAGQRVHRRRDRNAAAPGGDRRGRGAAGLHPRADARDRRRRAGPL